MNDKTIIFGGGNGWFNACFLECEKDKSIVIGKDCFSPYANNYFQRIFYHFVFSRRLGKDKRDDFFSHKILNGLCKQIYKKNKAGCVCIFNRTNHLSHNKYFLEKLKETVPNIKLVYWYTDIVGQVVKSEENLLQLCRECYDKVITYDPYDAERYGYDYIETPYSTLCEKIEEHIKYDLVYIGSAKIQSDPERYKTIITIFEKACKNGLKVKFYIHGVPRELQKYPENIVYNKYLDYYEVVRLVKNSRCILEVSQRDETGTTLRFFEAIAYDKKLIMTNNILETHPYFNDKYMKIIDVSNDEMIESICNFIKEKEDVRYDNKQCLSPYIFIEKVHRLLNRNI